MGRSASCLPRGVWLCNEESSNSPNTAHQNSLPTSPPGNVHYPPQQQQMQGFDPSATPALQYQQQYQHPANIPVDPTAVGQLQPQHQQQQYGSEECGGEEYGGEEHGGKGNSGKEYGGEEYCGEGYGGCAGGGGFDYGGGEFGGILGGGGDDPGVTGISNDSSYIYNDYMMARLNAELLARNAIMTGMLNARIDAQSRAHNAMMTGLKNSASYI